MHGAVPLQHGFNAASLLVCAASGDAEGAEEAARLLAEVAPLNEMQASLLQRAVGSEHAAILLADLADEATYRTVCEPSPTLFRDSSPRHLQTLETKAMRAKATSGQQAKKSTPTKTVSGIGNGSSAKPRAVSPKSVAPAKSSTRR